MKNDLKEFFMREALKEAARPRLSVLPNPEVGAVLVKDEKIIARGHHKGPGTSHAEVDCIKNAERSGIRNFKDTTLFVTLEPCCHLNKRTPPCAQYLLKKNIQRVVVAQLDPNPNVSGRGIRLLKKAGVFVEHGILRDEAERHNQPYLKNFRSKLPYVSLKIAMTFDGKMADDFSGSKWISGENSRELVHLLRSKVDAIGIGKRTAEIDRPRLSVRLKDGSTPKEKPVVVFGTPPASWAKKKEKNPLIIVRGDTRTALLELKKQHGLYHILIEGGPRLASGLLKEGLIDEAHLFYGRGFMLGRGKNTLSSAPLRRLSQSTKFRPAETRILGDDVYVKGFFRVYRSG